MNRCGALIGNANQPSGSASFAKISHIDRVSAPTSTRVVVLRLLEDDIRSTAFYNQPAMSLQPHGL